jgi:hypothetical protein
MVRYNEWLKTLTSAQRAELLSLSGEQRIERIKQIQQQQEAQHFRGLVASKVSQDDLRKIREWLEDFVERNEQQLLDALPAEFRQPQHVIADDQRRRGMLMFSLTRRVPGQAGPLPTQEDIRELEKQLSPDARQTLQSVRDAAQKEKIVQEWTRAAFFARRMTHVSDEQLQQFFRERLDPQQQAELESLPKDQLNRELRRRYSMDRFRGPPGDGRPPFHGWPREDRDGSRGEAGRGEAGRSQRGGSQRGGSQRGGSGGQTVPSPKSEPPQDDAAQP